MMTPFAVAIVNYNTREHLHACLTTVQPEAPSEVVIVDNGSSDGSVEMVHANYPFVALCANKVNLGYCALHSEICVAPQQRYPSAAWCAPSASRISRLASTSRHRWPALG